MNILQTAKSGSLHPICSAWGCLWRSKNKLDGLREHLIRDGGVPALFRDRKSARAFIKSKYGYILRRPDLRDEPHGWRLPMAVRVEVKPNHRRGEPRRERGQNVNMKKTSKKPETGVGSTALVVDGSESGMQKCADCWGTGVNSGDIDMPPVWCHHCGGTGRTRTYASRSTTADSSDSRP